MPTSPKKRDIFRIKFIFLKIALNLTAKFITKYQEKSQI
ncbi:hypothetical protein UNSW1_737 [Campylobacter concisus UNSW1]|nr:hypothetical protein UNSW1_737 [Campylobacter concisus UNSW1]